MKRLPLIAAFVLFIGLCASIAYWVMEYTKPPLRPIAPPPRAGQADIAITSAAGLFGGNRAVAVASNYQLKGIVVAGNPSESIAILAADGKPAQAVRVGKEILPGTVVQEVQARHVLLSEGGIVKRVDLPENIAPSPPPSAANPLSGRAMFPPPGAGGQPYPQGVPPLPQIPSRGGPPQGMPPGEPPDESPVPSLDERASRDQRQGTVIPETGMPPGFPPPDPGPPEESMDAGIPPEQQGMPPDMQQ